MTRGARKVRLFFQMVSDRRSQSQLRAPPRLAAENLTFKRGGGLLPARSTGMVKRGAAHAAAQFAAGCALGGVKRSAGSQPDAPRLPLADAQVSRLPPRRLPYRCSCLRTRGSDFASTLSCGTMGAVRRRTAPRHALQRHHLRVRRRGAGQLQPALQQRAVGRRSISFLGSACLSWRLTPHARPRCCSASAATVRRRRAASLHSGATLQHGRVTRVIFALPPWPPMAVTHTCAHAHYSAQPIHGRTSCVDSDIVVTFLLCNWCALTAIFLASLLCAAPCLLHHCCKPSASFS